MRWLLLKIHENVEGTEIEIIIKKMSITRLLMEMKERFLLLEKELLKVKKQEDVEQ